MSRLFDRSSRPVWQKKRSRRNERAAAKGKAALKVALADKNLKARYANALERYQRSTTEATESWDDRYEALGEIIESDPPLYLAGGYQTERAFLAKFAPDLDERTAKTNIRVARHFDAGDLEYGVSKLELLLDYLEASGGAKLGPVKIHTRSQKVKIPAGKIVRSIPFADAKTRQLREAVRAARGKHGVAGKTQSPFMRALRKRLVQHKLAQIGLRQRKEVVDFSDVPEDRLHDFAKALLATRLPG